MVRCDVSLELFKNHRVGLESIDSRPLTCGVAGEKAVVRPNVDHNVACANGHSRNVVVMPLPDGREDVKRCQGALALYAGLAVYESHRIVWRSQKSFANDVQWIAIPTQGCKCPSKPT